MMTRKTTESERFWTDVVASESYYDAMVRRVFDALKRMIAKDTD